MADRKAESNNDFAHLRSQGLYASKIEGDGNCLFNALSDQLYGHQRNHVELRASTVKQMRQHGNDYKPYLAVYPGGGTRRNAQRKRKNAGAMSSESYQTKAPSPEDIEDAFTRRLEHMARDGTYADNIEVQAFADAHQKNVQVYWFDGKVTAITPSCRRAERIATVHIAYHKWEHYSSIRNIDGPHEGLPLLKIKDLSEEELAEQRAIAAEPRPITTAMIDEVTVYVPQFERDIIQKALEESRGDTHAAVNKLLDTEDSSSTSSHWSSSATSFTERDPDSEDEEPRGPKKRRNVRSKIVASVEKSEPIKQYVPSHLSTSVTADSSDTAENILGKRVLPLGPPKPQRLKLRVKPRVKDSSESCGGSDSEFVLETPEDDEDNDAASEDSSGTNRSVSSARPLRSCSRSASKLAASQDPRDTKSQAKRVIKQPRRRTAQALAPKSTPKNTSSSSVKARAIKT